MTTFHLDANQIAAIASLHAATPPARTDRDMTPIIAAIMVTVTPATVSAIATDRYMVAALDFPLGETAHTIAAKSPLSFLIPSTEWQRIAKLKSPADFTLSDTDANPDVTVEYVGGSITVAQTVGNFPPVQRLIPATTDSFAADTLLNVALLARMAKFVTPSNAAVSPAKRETVFSFAQSADSSATDSRLAPVLATYTPFYPTAADKAESLRVLVQPNRTH